VREGDLAKLGLLFERYHVPLFEFLSRVTGDRHVAEDLVQDIFVRAYRSIAGFRGESSFRSWLYRISVNVVHNHRDSRGFKEMSRAVALEPDESVEQFSVMDDVEGTLARRQAIDLALAALPPDMRLLVVLRDVHGLKYEEIARIVKMRPGTVDSKLFRARQRLRPMLEQFVSGRT
jgi:RNA polymerase sigma-70 factor (ECF subfamily)